MIAALVILLATTLWYGSDGSGDGRAPAPSADRQHHSSAGFDFYVLALSWSPTFCQSSSAGNAQQCDSGRYPGFIVHGLWPQFESGYPEFCPSEEPDRVPASLGRIVKDIMPGMGLVGHQWRKHGSCSGLSQRDYFTLVRKARDRITLPQTLDRSPRTLNLPVAEIEQQMLSSNPGLTREAIAVTCDGNRLDEIRICLTKDLDFRACHEVDRKSCPLTDVVVPALR